ncbi:DegT/DnrJ/EryC1/StrS family aminotransferase [Marinoscillum sp.]|uniref:DegT/DnrJ/EryC1/StrS family aminotransferase n=1 Tax=Marinoscillum sp. TaxID=2024838 RepID=UPI003BAC23EE
MSFEVPFVSGPPVDLQNKYINEVVSASDSFWKKSLTTRCEDWFFNHLGGEFYFLDSCTTALRACAILLNLRPGDEIIFPSFTHVSTVIPFVMQGAVPVFVDVDGIHFCIDANKVSAAITGHTRAVVAVNYGGWAPDYMNLRDLCDQHDLKLIEDNAHGMGAGHRGHRLGTFGDYAVFSFEKQKNITCHEGGLLLINTADSPGRVERLMNLGTNRLDFERKKTPHYEWVDLGLKASFTELQAAMLLPQLEALDQITAERRDAWQWYYDRLEPYAKSGLFKIPATLNEGDNAHVFYVLLQDQVVRDQLRAHLLRQSLEAQFHYFPLHKSTYGSKVGRFVGSDEHTMIAGMTMLRLPLFQGISLAQQERVAAAVIQFFTS